MIGFHSDMIWLPEHGVGAVVLTNGDPGMDHPQCVPTQAPEVLFDGKHEADGQIAAQAKAFFDDMAADGSCSRFRRTLRLRANWPRATQTRQWVKSR